ncbi:MAG: hypothetical protein EOO45_23010, partial [Flavobacterium sp.]
MKTNYSPLRKISLYSILGILGVAVSSCGSYQNTSSYENDPIYGSSANGNRGYQYNDGQVTQYRDGDVSGQNMNYKAYFQSLENQYPATSFTDVDEYSTYNDTVVVVENYNNAGWGEGSDNVTVNVYDNGGYGYNNFYGGWGGWGMG